jgi:hypothetical protein
MSTQIASIKKRHVGGWLVASVVLGTPLGIGLAWLAHHFWANDFTFGTFLVAYLKLRIHEFASFIYPTQGPAIREVLSEFSGWLKIFHGSILIGWATAGWLSRSQLAERDSAIYLRGAKLLDQNGVVAFARDTAPQGVGRMEKLHAKRNPEKRDVDFIPGEKFDDGKWQTHVNLLGGTGAGKTTIMLNWLHQIVRLGSDRLLIVDVKSDFITFWKNVYILDPSDSRTLYWDIARDIRTGPEADSFAAMMVPSGTGADAVWGEAARNVVAGLIIKLQKTKPQAWTWGDLSSELRRDGEDIRSDLGRYAPAKLNSMPEADATESGVLFNIAAKPLAAIDGIAEAYALLEISPTLDKRKFSFRDWAGQDKPRHRKIILRMNGRAKTQAEGFITAALDYVSRLMTSPELKENSPIRTWIFFDEFAQVPKIDSLQAILALGRGRNFRLITGTQERSQITHTYGEAAGSIYTTGPGISIIGRLTGPAAEDAAKFLGSQDIAKPSHSTSASVSGHSSSLSYQESSRQLIHPAELGKLGVSGPGVKAYAKVGDKVYLLRWPFPSKVEARAKEAPWTHLKGAFPFLSKIFHGAEAEGCKVNDIFSRLNRTNATLDPLEKFSGNDIYNLLFLRGLPAATATAFPQWPAFLAEFGSLTVEQAITKGKEKFPPSAMERARDERMAAEAAQAAKRQQDSEKKKELKSQMEADALADLNARQKKRIEEAEKIAAAKAMAEDEAKRRADAAWNSDDLDASDLDDADGFEEGEQAPCGVEVERNAGRLRSHDMLRGKNSANGMGEQP